MARASQEHLALVRQLAGALPARFADLAALGGGDAETDPLVNLAHLQLHRRTRALNRLAQARQRPCAVRHRACHGQGRIRSPGVGLFEDALTSVTS